MSESSTKADDDEDMLPEYDLTGRLRGEYAERYAKGTNVILLDPDVAEKFPTSAAVNEALRRLAR